MMYLAAEPALFIGLVLLLGLAVDSFLNVVIHRLPRMMEAEWQAQCAERQTAAVVAIAVLDHHQFETAPAEVAHGAARARDRADHPESRASRLLFAGQ